MVRRLVLKEEVILRRVSTTEHHVETVTLREQQVVVSRTAPDQAAAQSAPSAISQPTESESFNEQ